MKKILITGEKSYIGTKFEDFLMQWPQEYNIKKISVRNSEWKTEDWSDIDVILNVAGIVHADQRKSSKEVFFDVNCNLAYEIALKAKNDGVHQFIQLSTMNVFGKTRGEIGVRTKPLPLSLYGKSKLAGDRLIAKLYEKNSFHISIIRPPMVYGEHGPGNYNMLAKIAKIVPVFPKNDNKRSMIYIENLTTFMKLLIDNFDHGYFYPQNKNFVMTREMVKQVAEFSNKKIYFVKLNSTIFNLLLKIPIFEKVFGDLIYTKELSTYKDNKYQIVGFKDSIKKTELIKD